MPRLKVVKLKNLSPIHIGTGRESYDVSAGELHSDTLSSALVAIGVSTGLCENVQTFLSSIRISSAFPYWGNCYFLPKPQGRLNVTIKGLQEHEYRKRLKAIRYIESSLWQTLVSGEKLHVNNCQVRGQYLIPSDADMGKVSKSQVTQRVGVSRDGATDAEPFFFEWKYYDNHAGLYCLVDANDSAMKVIVKLFESLGIEGIGTDKSVGGGKFDVEVSEMDLREPSNADSTMLLSLFIPSEEDFKDLLTDTPHYSLLHRGGYMAGSSVERFRHLRKKTVYAFGVGSTFHTTKRLEGKIVDVTPEWNDSSMHPIYRSGKPLTVNIKSTGL